MPQLLEHLSKARQNLFSFAELEHKEKLGQFMTPKAIADFLVSLFPDENNSSVCRLLDAGAGEGALSTAFLRRFAKEKSRIELSAYEIDELFHCDLKENLAEFVTQTTGPRGCDQNYHGKDIAQPSHIHAKIIPGDFIEHAVRFLGKKATKSFGFTHAVLNPPYKKINSQSQHRLLLRSVGVETVNLYSAFVALAISLMQPGGQVVAIIPRSFCNGPYYRPFRDYLFENTAIRYIHLFESRTKAFQNDHVLQENVIVRLERAAKQDDVTVSTSTDQKFDDLTTQTYSFDEIVSPQDSDRFIHIPNSTVRKNRKAIRLESATRYSLDDLGIQVSTGPVVDFRLKEHLCLMPEKGAVPLLYPVHFNNQRIDWPKPNQKKPNAIQRNPATEKWLFPNGFYCVVRRFSSKEERHRIVPAVVSPHAFGSACALGFENHLNVFHENRAGLPEPLACGLSLFLSSSLVDDAFRRFSGHTQVNATDLRGMKYPSREVLFELGQWVMKRNEELTQEIIDQQLEKKLSCR